MIPTKAYNRFEKDFFEDINKKGIKTCKNCKTIAKIVFVLGYELGVKQ